MCWCFLRVGRRGLDADAYRVCGIMMPHAVHAVSCRIMPYHAVSCRGMPYHAVSCRGMPYHAVVVREARHIAPKAPLC